MTYYGESNVKAGSEIKKLSPCGLSEMRFRHLGQVHPHVKRITIIWSTTEGTKFGRISKCQRYMERQIAPLFDCPMSF